MKTIFKLLLLLSIAVPFGSKLNAQTCKIRVYYDENGYRVKRMQDCTGGRPAAPPDSSNMASTADSLNKLAAGTFKIYPNPTQMQVSVLLDELSLQSPCSLTITDATGRAFKTQALTSQLTEIDLSGFTDGTYYFRLQRGNVINTVKVAKVYGSGDR